MRTGAADWAETFFARSDVVRGKSTLTVTTISVRRRRCEPETITEFRATLFWENRRTMYHKASVPSRLIAAHIFAQKAFRQCTTRIASSVREFYLVVGR